MQTKIDEEVKPGLQFPQFLSFQLCKLIYT